MANTPTHAAAPALKLVDCDDVRAAAARIGDEIQHTPATRSKTLSAVTGAQIHLKFEIMQFTASFKERGALNKLLQLTDSERKRGVIAMSAGNHAQAVSYHATRLGIPATIVMPENTPFTKVQNTRRLGAEVVLNGATLSDAARAAHETAEQNGAVFVHPYDDPDIIAGQGTLAIEFLESFPDLDALVVPIGGGGLASGVACAAKSLKPDIEVIGVQTERYPAMKCALSGEPFTGGGDSVAEGIAVKEPGLITREMVRKYVDDILVVSERQIEDAIIDLLEIEKVLVEGAGAAPLAAVLQFPERFRDRRTGLVLSGGNIDLRLVASAIMRSLARDGRISRLRILIPDIPGSLVKVSTVIAEAGGNVIEVEHQRHFGLFGHDDAEPFGQIRPLRNGVVVQVHETAALGAAGIGGKRNGDVFTFVIGRARGFRHLDLDCALHDERTGQHEEDEQLKDHVDQRRQVEACADFPFRVFGSAEFHA